MRGSGLEGAHLVGRAIVDVTIGREGAEPFVGTGGGGGKPEAYIRIAVDGYSAPITAGNFVSNILSGAYDGARLAIGGETVSITSTKLEGKALVSLKFRFDLKAKNLQISGNVTSSSNGSFLLVRILLS